MTIITGLILFMISACASNAGLKPDEAQWTLLWSDEFDGNAIDDSRWNYIIGAGGYGNNELQYYSDREKNARVERGRLFIEAHDEAFNGSPYTAAKLTTEGKGDWLYGRFDIRARLPRGQGIWPAIWMMPTDYKAYGIWPSSGEIDIVELLGHEPSTVHGTIHYGNPHRYTGTFFQLEEGSFSDDFHLFSLEWDPGEFRWYVDGELYQTQRDWFSRKTGEAADYTWPAPFDREFYLQLNVAVGGNWPGYPDESTVFPQAMEIDYVRVYQRNEGYKPVEKTAEDEPLKGRDSLPDGNYVYNSGFDDELEYWEFGNYEGGSGSALWEDGEVHIAINEAGNQIWANQLLQHKMNVEKGGSYRVRFKARAAAPRAIMLKIGGLGDRGWAAYSQEQYIEIDTVMREYSFEFTMAEDTDIHARYEFNMGLSDSDLWLDDAVMERLDVDEDSEETATVPAFTPKAPLASGNLVYNGNFDQGNKRIAFWDLELDPDSDAELRVPHPLGERSLQILVLWHSGNAEGIVLSQDGLTFRAGEDYTLSFDARTKSPQTATLQVGNESNPAAYSGNIKVELEEDWKRYSYTVSVPSVSDPNGLLRFMIDPQLITYDTWLDNVRLVRIKKPLSLPSVSTRIEAEDYFDKSDNPRTQESSEGGLNVGWLETGDWLSYDLDVARAGTYRITYRLASERTNGKISLQVDERSFPELSFAGTGYWQEWTDLEQEIELAAGVHTLRIYAARLNINWFELERL